MNLFCKVAMGGCVLASLFGDTVTVHVGCSNGKNVPNLPITVIDDAGTTVPVQSTDGEGNFSIENAELYISPFFMSFVGYGGSTCGPYYIPISNDSGYVDLNYYPTDLPCSCAHLTESGAP